MNSHEATGTALERGTLSPKEQALWLFHSYTDLGVLNVPSAVRVSRPLRPQPLQRAVDQVVARHPALRSVFPNQDGTPVRRVLAVDDPAARCRVHRVEVDAGSLAAQMTALAQRPFEIEAQPPIRVGHFVGAPEGDVVCLVIQHIACDAESFGVLINELSRLYQAAERDEPVPADLVGEVPLFVEPAPTPADIAYWRAELAGAEKSPRLLDIGRVGVERGSYTAGQYSTPLSDAATESLTALRTELAMTPNITLMAIFSVLLSISGAGSDMVIGVPVDARGRGAGDTVGYHINLLAVRVPTPPETTFRSVAHHLRQTYLTGLTHASACLDEVLPGSYEATGAYSNPLLRHMFNYRPERTAVDDGLVIAGVPTNIAYTRLDLQVTAFAGADRIDLAALYSDELFDQADVVALLDRMDLLIRICAQMPDVSLADLAVLVAPTDRSTAAQPAPVAADQPVDAGPDVATEQEVFELLVGLWREVLRAPDLDPDAHFFRSGGNSLRAAQLVARVKLRIGVKLSLRHIFRAPTPRQLARVVATVGRAGA